VRTHPAPDHRLVVALLRVLRLLVLTDASVTDSAFLQLSSGEGTRPEGAHERSGRTGAANPNVPVGHGSMEASLVRGRAVCDEDPDNCRWR